MNFVIPAKAGIQLFILGMDPRIKSEDDDVVVQSHYENNYP